MKEALYKFCFYFREAHDGLTLPACPICGPEVKIEAQEAGCYLREYDGGVRSCPGGCTFMWLDPGKKIGNMTGKQVIKKIKGQDWYALKEYTRRKK